MAPGNVESSSSFSPILEDTSLSQIVGIPEASRMSGARAASGNEDSSPALMKGDGKESKSSGKKRAGFALAPASRKPKPGATRKRSSASSGSSEQRKSTHSSPPLAAQTGKTASKPAAGPIPTLRKCALVLCFYTVYFQMAMLSRLYTSYFPMAMLPRPFADTQ
jgi:hypothetical protein